MMRDEVIDLRLLYSHYQVMLHGRSEDVTPHHGATQTQPSEIHANV